jgi:hypothetical protein
MCSAYSLVIIQGALRLDTLWSDPLLLAEPVCAAISCSAYSLVIIQGALRLDTLWSDPLLLAEPACAAISACYMTV